MSGAKIGILFLIIVFLIAGNIFFKLISVAFALTLIITFSYQYYSILYFLEAGSLLKDYPKCKSVNDYDYSWFWP